MFSNREPIEDALREVEQARKRITRIKTTQIRNADVRDYLKSVAYSWFRNHRSLIVKSIAEDVLRPVDIELTAVLDATTRSSTRSTYLAALKAAQSALAALRGIALVPLPKSISTPEAPPDFSALASDLGMKSILERRWNECQRCILGNAPLAATVMMGGLLEALFVARANSMNNKSPLFKAKSTPIDWKTKKPLALPEWTLRPYIDVGAEIGWITSSGKEVAAILRDYRNYIHPEKERAHGVVLNDHDSAMFWEVTKNLVRQLLSSSTKLP